MPMFDDPFETSHSVHDNQKQHFISSFGLSDNQHLPPLEKQPAAQQKSNMYVHLAELKENPPVQKRVLVQHVTIEKLGELLSSNENGLYFLFDELISLFKTIEKPDATTTSHF
jgi:hypothetical protein